MVVPTEDTMDIDEEGEADMQGASLQAYEREYNDERCAPRPWGTVHTLSLQAPPRCKQAGSLWCSKP
jgi:hypothetical protein